MRRVPQILVIEDDLATRDLLRQVLSDEGYEVLIVERPERAEPGIAPALVITDLVGLRRYQSGPARESIGRVRERYPGTPTIVCTGYEQAMEEFDRLGADAVLLKPFTIEALVETVTRLAAR